MQQTRQNMDSPGFKKARPSVQENLLFSNIFWRKKLWLDRLRAPLFVGPPRAWDAERRQAGGQLLAPSDINTDNRYFGQTQVATDMLSGRLAGRTGVALSYPQQPRAFRDDT